MSSQRDQGAHSPRLEAVIQKLEESLLHSDGSSGERTLTLQGDGEGSGVTSVSTRIRQIITRNLAEQSAGASSEVSELEENRALREQLSQSQMDRDQPLVKQASLTDRLDQMLMLDSDQDSVSPGSLQLHIKERAYRQKLRAYQEAQQRQGQLVQKLQTKVLQYKKRCGELEEQVLEKTSESEKMRLLLQAHLDSAQRQQRTEQDLNMAIQSKSAQLEEEQKRCASLSQVNSMLREQLDQAGTVNQGLTESLWKAREDADLCDTRLRREQETCASRLCREQARVRTLWRQAASLRNTFTQLRTFTDRTLSDMSGECVAASRQLNVACMNLEARVTQESTSSGVETSALERQLKDKLKEAMQLQGRWDAEKVDLNSRILELTDTVKHLRSQNSEKDSSLKAMQISLDRMETRRAEDKAEMEVLHTEIQAHQKMLYHVHQMIGGEGDGSSGSESASSSPLHGRSPLRNTTLMAVQSVWSKHQKQTQDLRGRLDAALEQVETLRDHLQERDTERRELEQKIQEVRRESQETKTALEESLRDSNRYRCSLELISSEKGSLEKLLSGLQQEADSQHAALEVLRGSSLEIQRQRDLLRQQREDLEIQLTRQRTEAQRGERSLEELEGKHSDLRRELVTVKEALSQITLQKEVLEEDKASLALALSKMESQSASHELVLTKLQNQEAALKDSLAKMAALSEGLAKDKVELNRILLQTEGEKTELGKRRREAEMERAAYREETARVQQEMMNLLAEKQALESSHSHLQDLCQRLETELGLLQTENALNLEQHSQVNRQMQTVSEELCACRKELETQTTALRRATHDREELAKARAALDVKLNSADRRACGLTQELVSLRAEKESLETALFESQELALSLEAECTRMEGERRSLLLANEALTRDAARMRVDAEHQFAQAAQERSNLEEKLAQVERNALLTLNNKEQIHREQHEAERRQKEQQYAELTIQQEQAEEQLRRQCEEQRVHSQKELQQVQEELVRLQQDCNQSLLQAESEKQQALSQKEAEKAALTEKLAALQQDLATAGMELECMQREALSKQEQDKNAKAVLQSELQDLQTQFEESLNSHEDAKKSLIEQVRQLNQQREHTQQELEGLRRHLQETEDGLIKGRRELLEAHRELQECAQERDKQRKEALDLRRLLGDETREKEAIQASNQELRAFIKRAESDNSSLRRALEEREQKVSVSEECRSSMHQEASTLRSSMRELEKSRLQARRDLQELRRQVKVLEGENSRQKQELRELQARVCQEEQKEEEARREAFTLKQRVLECEAGREAALNEVSGLQRRVVELETSEHQNRELLQEREAYQQQCDQRHRETTAQLEEALEDAGIKVKELSVHVGFAESKVQGLEEQLGLSHAKHRDLELKLAGMYSAVRRTVGTSRPRLSGTPGFRRRSPSPWRNHLQVKGVDNETDRAVLPLSRGEDEELDVDSVHTALQEFQQKFRDTQRDRDEATAQIVVLSQQVTELQGSQDKSATQLLQLQKSLKQSEQGKREMAERLHEAHTSLSLQEEVVRRTESEKQSLEEEVAQLRTGLQAAEAESRALQDKSELLQGLESRANVEQQKLKESLQAAESRVSRLELSQRTLEGELQRAQLRAAELDAEAGALQERLTELRRKLGESEDRGAALRVSEERLAMSLARAEQHESHLREQVHKLSNTLSDNRTSSGALQEQITQLQRALTASEQDRRLLQERLDKTRDALSERKSLNHALTEQIQNLQRAQEDLELKYFELEKHSRTQKESLKQQQEAELQAQGSSQQLQREKEELQDKVNNLQSSLQKLQSERAEMERVLTRLAKDKSALRKTLERVEMERLRREEEEVSAAREKEQLGHTVRSLEQELAKKQDEEQTVQAQISQLEHSHAQRLLEVTARHHQELDMETERLRDSQLQAERALETREKAHRQRVKCLEEQVLTLKEQLDQETRRRQAYFNQMLQPVRRSVAHAVPSSKQNARNLQYSPVSHKKPSSLLKDKRGEKEAEPESSQGRIQTAVVERRNVHSCPVLLCSCLPQVCVLLPPLCGACCQLHPWVAEAMVLVLQALLPCFCTLLSLDLLPGVELAVPLEDFYPFGQDKGDSQTISQDDGGSRLVEISVAFPFFGDRHTGLYVNNNGLVSFLREVSQFTPVAFPIAGDRRVVAPFWADVDNRRAGRVFYRESQEPSILRRASGDVRTYFSEFPNFNATWLLICTWHQVTFFGGNSLTPVNTFQVVLITDGELSFTIFQYNNITWTTGMHASSGGNLAGLGGIAAQAGFNAGDGKRYFNIPGSRTADVVNVEGTTNVGYPGKWVFRIDDANVEVGGCNNSASVCPHLRPCLNGGQCIDDCITGNPSFTCSCLAGFTGRRCQIDVDECASYPCQNGGTCEDQINSFICHCPRGYTGIQCETDIDECKDRPCLNNALCVQGTGSFTCVCEPGYTGVLCETDINECESQPCLNGGECIDQVANFTCICPAAFTGALCETELEVLQDNSTEAENQTALCEEEDCKKHQICKYTSSGIYNCTCAPGFYGDECEEECLCQNGGVCVDINGTCECPSGYTGLYCQFEVTQTPCSNSRPCPDGAPCLEYGGAYLCTCQTSGAELDHKDFYPYVQPRSVCDSSPCLNGGYCYERDGGYTCECKYGHWGKHCEKVRLNTCASGPCRNGGSCKEEAGSYRCVCPYRFAGKHCEVGKPDPCSSSPCLNGGTCFHYIGKYKCECTEAFNGRHCEISRSSVPITAEFGCGLPPQVKNAEVQFSLTTPGSMAVYICHSGFTSVPRATQSICGIQGDWSQPPICEEINECLSQPCLNGGTCRNQVGSYQCECNDGFSGNRCQTDINECLSEPCKHGGTCEDQPGSYMCHCSQGLKGQNCEIEQDGCESNPCLNGGVCRDYRRNYLCVCKDGFFGDQCQMLENPCVLQPCGNRGLCRSDKRGNYNCVCRVGHTGKDCEKDLLPPSGLHVLRVEENEVELRWDEPDPLHSLISGFIVTYGPLGWSNHKTDFLERQQSTHVMRGLEPGLLYNISTFSIKRNANNNDNSQPATALIRTRPRRVEQLQVVNVSSSQVWLSWLVHHAAVSRVHVSLLPSDGSEARTAVFNASTTEHTFSSLLPGQMYTVDVLTQSGIRPDEFPSSSHSAGPLQFWTRPLPPQNLSLSHVTTNSALITWSRHPRNVPDGFVVNVTRGLNTRSRFLPSGKLGSYTLRELTPGQHYYVALTSVKSTGQEQIHSIPQHLAFTTLPMGARSGRRERPNGTGQGTQVGRILPPSQPQDLGGTTETHNSEELHRYTELIDRRGKITAKFTQLPRKAIRHRTKPDPPIRLEKMEETTNKISLALEIQEEGLRTKPELPQDCRSLPCQNGGTCVNGGDSFICDCAAGFKGRQCELLCQRVPHPCTRLYSETKSVPVWEGGVCHYLYKRTYKVQQDVCYREICEPMPPKKSPSRRTGRQQ